VLLVLLIIFMAASIRVHVTMDGQLPLACAGACEGTSSIVLEVLPGPAYRVNKTPVPVDALRERLASIYSTRPEKIIQIAGYTGATYQDVVSAMDIAKSAGIAIVGIAPKDAYLPR
jgi:biopolymer transport protein ExbD